MQTTDYPRKMCSFYGKDALTSSFNEFKMALAVPVCENRSILRRLERVFRCCSVCETMEDYKEGHLICLISNREGLGTSL